MLTLLSCRCSCWVFFCFLHFDDDAFMDWVPLWQNIVFVPIVFVIISVCPFAFNSLLLSHIAQVVNTIYIQPDIRLKPLLTAMQLHNRLLLFCCLCCCLSTLHNFTRTSLLNKLKLIITWWTAVLMSDCCTWNHMKDLLMSVQFIKKAQLKLIQSNTSSLQ